MRKPIVRLMACTLLSVGLTAVSGITSAGASVTPDPDGATCEPVGAVQGTGSWTPPVTASVLPHSVSMAVQAQCTQGTGDEVGTYTLTLTGTSTEDCGGGTGSGLVSGSSPEGTVSGNFSYFKIGIHYYISGMYTAAGENHTLQLWLDVVPPLDPNQVCFYSVASLIGHGAFADVPSASGTGAGGIDFSGTTTSLTPVQLAGGSGVYSFESTVCAAATTVVVGTCTLAASGTYANIICGTGTTGGGAGGPETDVASIDGGALTIHYGITFVNGSGTLTGTFVAGSGATGLVTGSVEITPTGGNCATGVTQFTATGHLTLG